jgi:peptide/nickel transport system permease protein
MRFVVGRLFQAVPLVLAAFTINFILIHAAPGDPVYVLIGESSADPDYIQMMREKYDLDKPLPTQFLLYVQKLLMGDLGYSYYYKQPVLGVILERMPATLLLMGTGFVFATILGIIIGVFSAKKPYSLRDNFISFASVFAFSLPTFWLGMLLVLFFSYYLGLFPTTGMFSLRTELSGIAGLLDVLHHLFLPAATVGLFHMAIIARLTRGSMLEAIRQNYIITARSKGLDENTVFFKHALRNALLPVITMVGLNFGQMVAGTVLVESVFAWPGMGRLMYDSIFARDYPVLMGIFLTVSLMVVLANLITDIMYGYLDVRIRYA